MGGILYFKLGHRFIWAVNYLQNRRRKKTKTKQKRSSDILRLTKPTRILSKSETSHIYGYNKY